MVLGRRKDGGVASNSAPGDVAEGTQPGALTHLLTRPKTLGVPRQWTVLRFPRDSL